LGAQKFFILFILFLFLTKIYCFISLLNLLFGFFYFLSLVFGLRVNTWGSLWIFLEVNMFSLFFLFLEVWADTLDFLIKYFFVQVFSSLLVLRRFFFWLEGVPLIFFFKMGAFPLHFWLISVVYYLSKVGIFFVLGAQKFFILFILFLFLTKIYCFISLLNLLFGFFLLGGVSRIKRFFFGSSFVQLRWMIIFLRLRLKILFLYYLIYIMLLYFVLFWGERGIFGLIFLAYIGIPFTPMFYFKWQVLCFVGGGIIFIFFLIMGGVFYAYFRIFFFFFFSYFSFFFFYFFFYFSDFFFFLSSFYCSLSM